MFLDLGADRNSIALALEEGPKKMEGGSPAIMIGTIWSSDLAGTLSELYRPLLDEGFSLSAVAHLMMEEANARPRH